MVFPLTTGKWFILFSILLHLAFAYRFTDHVQDEEDHHGNSLRHDPNKKGIHEGHGPINQKWQPVTHLADIPPPTAAVQCYREDWSRSDWLLSRYWDENAGFSNKQYGDDDDDQHALTYGEVTSLGVRQLAYEMGIAVELEDDECVSSPTTKNDVIFYDLGSGVGRLVTQMYFDQPQKIRKAVGVELALDRHEIARQALMDIQSMQHCFDDGIAGVGSADEDGASFPVVVLLGDALQVDWADATHVFMSSLCFPEHVLKSLQESALEVPNLQVVAALNRLDVLRRHDSWEEREVPIQMSWGPGVAKFYRRKRVPPSAVQTES